MLAEIATGDALFCGDAEVGQLPCIHGVMRAPTERGWLGIANAFHRGAKMECSQDRFVRALYTNGLDLLKVSDSHTVFIILPYSPSLTSF